MTQATTDCSIFFRSKAYCYEALLNAWQKWVVRQSNAFEVSGRKVLLGDHTAAVKDGRRMPGVVSMHESSETLIDSCKTAWKNVQGIGENSVENSPP